MYASVELALRQRRRKAAHRIRFGGARQQRHQSRFVLVQRGEGKFEPREVKLGQPQRRLRRGVEGLKEGETVVVSR